MEDIRPLAFIHGERWGPDFELYLMRANGTRIRRLTRNSVPDLVPDWQPIPR